MSRKARVSSLFLALCVLFWMASCGSKSVDEQPKETSAGVPEQGPTPATLENFDAVENGSDAPQLTITLKDGSAADQDGALEVLKRPETKALSASETAKLLARMPTLVEDVDDRKDFAKRERSLPPPKTGEVVKGEFPPPASKTRPADVKIDADAPLEVARYAPEGDVPIAPKLSVTFNQPMVAVTSHDDSIAQGVPVQLDPTPAGQWRWIGTKTLLFEPANERMPMATTYTVTIPAGSKATTDASLAEGKTFTFATPPVKLSQFWPNWGTHGLDQVMFMAFDQRVDTAKILEHIEIRTNDGNLEARAATSEEIAASPEIQNFVNNAVEGRWVAFRAKTPLPYNSNINVVLKDGAPSAEGPRTTESDQSFSFRTYGPFQIVRDRCGWRGPCKPNMNFSFEFSNQIDGEAFDDSWVKVEPDFPAKSISYGGNYLYVNGQKPGRKTYKVTILKDIKDEFGQTMEKGRTFEFDVTGADPAMYSVSGEFMVLDPVAEERGFTIFTTNYDTVKLVARRVDPTDYQQYLKWLRDYRYYGKHEQKPPGKVVINETVKIEGARDDLVQTRLDLSKVLNSSGLGNVVLEVTGGKISEGATKPYPNYEPKIRSWVQSTKIGLDAFVDRGEFYAWASDLASGEPLEGAEVFLAASKTAGTTNAKGIARLELPDSSEREQLEMLVARRGDDVAFLPRNTYSPYSSGWTKSYAGKQMRWFVFDDRTMYKPDEDVHLKGWVRAVDMSETGDVDLDSGVKEFSWTVYGPQNNKLAEGESKATGLGGFDLNFKLPKTPNLGYARVELRAKGGVSSGSSHTHTFQIQEFRTPEFEVKASAGEGPFYAGTTARANVEASYYAGGGLPNAEVNWNVSASPASFTPPNLGEFTFGSWTPWWVTRNRGGNATQNVALSGKTDATGMHFLDMSFSPIAPPRPMSVRAQATVMDVNRQAWTSATNLLVHPSQHYVGMKTERYFVERGKPLEVDLVVADVDGQMLSERPVKVRASRVKWTWRNSEYREELVDTQTCDFLSKGEESHRCTFKTDVGGTYKIEATTADDWGRLNYTQFTRWVSGGKRPVSRKIEIEDVNLIPDRDEYQPGQQAEILVQSPFVPAEGFMTIRRGGIVEEKRFTMSEPTMVLNVPIKNAHIPNVHVAVDLVGNAKRLDENGEEDDSLPRRPAIASGQLNLKVPPHTRILDVSLTPERERLEPGVKTWVDVSVRDADGKPVRNAEVAVVVVDEAILALSAYQMGDPMAVFYTTRGEGVSEHHLRPLVELVDPKALKASESAQPAPEARSKPSPKRRSRKKSGMARGMSLDAAEMPAAAPMEEMAMAEDEVSAQLAFGDADGEAAAEGGAIAVRSNFNPLAAFSPAVPTDASGKARIQVDMPDNLTRYRVMAVAVDGGKRFGTGEHNITARLPLMVRPSPPRFLNFGDKFEFPVVVQNQTDEPMAVKVATRTTNIKLASSDGVGYSLQVPANDRVEVRFRAAADEAGTARFQVAASAGKWSDAAEGNLPVWTPATSEAFATYGEIDDGTYVQKVKMPEEVWTQFGQLEVTTSSTALQSLTDAFIYLYEYEYECAEQISSRMISVAALRDVLQAFKAEGMPSEKDIARSMSRDIEELASRQNYDGGFGLWRKGQTSWPYVTLHASHALLRAEQKGYDVPSHVKQRMQNYMRRIESHIPGYYPEWTRLHIIAYSLYVRGLMKDWDPAKAREVMRRAGKLENLSFEATGWLLGVFANAGKGFDKERAEVRRFLNNRVTETAGNAHFAAQMNDGHHLIMHSNRRADGIILEALMDDQPKADLVPKIVKGLMAHRTAGRWGNTQENAFVLLALDKYFRIYEKETPDFVARVWLGETFAGEHAFKGRTTEQHQIDVPMSYVAEAAKDGEKLYLQKDGKGRLYYRIGMTYAPKSLFLEPADHGFVVERTYEAVDDPEDVTRRADGTWVVKAGAKVKVKLSMVAETRRYHVALVDPLPAGFESMNPALAVTGDLPQDKAMNTGRSSNYSWWWWSRPWYEHQNMRDERTEAFTTLLWGGVHEYTYYARATTPGEFVAPPTKAEEMYHPETFGRSASDRVVIK